MNNNLITISDNRSIAAEAYRTLRTNVKFSTYDEDMKVITVTSSKPGEGKSTLAGNLGVIFAENENKVLLIDADLRRPTIHKKFKLPNSIGIVNVILDHDRLFEATHFDIVPGLDVITSGITPPNPSELLGSKKSQKLIEKLRTMYDIIIFDSPPLLAVTDAQVLSTISDGTIIATQYATTKKDELVQSKKLLEKVKANILGVVLTHVPIDNEKYYQYTYEEKKRSFRSK